MYRERSRVNLLNLPFVKQAPPPFQAGGAKRPGDPSTIYTAGVLVPCFKATGINVLLKSAIDSRF